MTKLEIRMNDEIRMTNVGSRAFTWSFVIWVSSFIRHSGFVIRVCLACSFAITSLAADPVLKPGDSLAICGDSITEQKLYSVFIEDYLLMCKPVSNVSAMQFGWGGERAEGFVKRMENDVLRFKPLVATTCYGMNDGSYTKLTEQISNAYRDNMNKVVESFLMNKVRVVVVGSPGCVDSTTFRNPRTSAEEYNKTLAALRDIARETAKQRNLPFADVFQPMFDTMAKAKEKFGSDYAVAGRDGIHPGDNGHLIMAYAFLKALGATGDIGTITVDLSANKASGMDGHTVKSFDDGVATIESSRYPFCFLPGKDPADMKAQDTTRGIIEVLPFNDELNRYTLIVTGAQGNVKITWGETTKEFPAEKLAKGINLAAEFLDNPFIEPFRRVHDAVRAQQAYETPMIKALVNSRLRYGNLPGAAEREMEELIAEAAKTQKELSDTAEKSVEPVTHTIKIEVAN